MSNGPRVRKRCCCINRISCGDRLTEALKKTMNDALRKVVERLHDPLDVMLRCVRW